MATVVKIDEEHLAKVFTKLFLEGVMPILDKMQEEIKVIKETMATKDDIKNMATKDDIKNMAKGFARIERKLDKKEDKLGRHGKTIDNHERRITALETNVAS